jgi:5-methylcytosine-specific restriction endonuclease McrA
MIRYPVSLEALEEAVCKEKKNWLVKAKTYTAKCKNAKKYVDQGHIWSEIKGAYLKRQHHKCAYCERKLASTKRINADGTTEMIGPGSGEHDVDHFRPKSNVRQWPDEKIAASRKISYAFSLGSAVNRGYYLLAYNLWNYASSCRTCNSPLKSDFFPILGTRKTSAADPTKLKSERPLLLYPIGDIDDDPETILTFEGWLIKPVSSRGENYLRASVTIDFFELDTREELIRERSSAIVDMYIAHESLSSKNNRLRALAERKLKTCVEPRSMHTSCCRAFLKLLDSDPQRAADLATQAQNYLESES